MIKTAFKIILQHIMPDTLSYLCYICQFEEKATKRDVTYMKKLSRQELLHYAKEKGFTLWDTYCTLCDFDDKELKFFRSNKPILQSLQLKAKEIVRTLLLCRYEIFQIAEQLDKFVFNNYKTVKPEKTAKYFLNFYKESSNISIFTIYDIKRKSIVRDQREEEEVYALTDSDQE